LKIFESICMGIITICVAILLIELSLLARDVRRDVDSLSATANQTVSQLRDASEQAKLAATAGAAAANEQRAYWQKTSLETYKTMASLRLTIVRTDRSINDEISPRLALALDNTNRLSSVAAEKLEKTMDQLQPVLGNLAQASAGAATAMNDPAIHETISHLDETSARAALAAAQTEQIAGHLNDASRDFAAYVHRMTAPAKGIYSVLKTLLGLAAQARQAGGI
jgi:ABC-type transporter Mla subunit MlaD